MAGRGWLINRLSQTNANECKEPPKPLDNNISEASIPGISNGVQQQNNGITKQPISDTSNGIHLQDNNTTITPIPIVNNGIHPQVVRGRRAFLNLLDQKSKVDVNIESGFSSLNLENSTNIRSKTNNVDTIPVPTIPIQPQSTVSPSKEPIETKIKEEPPVICRVLPKSEKDTYVMAQLSSNYIQLEVEENKGLYEYNVDFNPPIDFLSVKISLLNKHRELFPVKVFDGDILFLPTMLQEKITILTARLNDGTEVTITIKFKFKKTLSESIKFYNLFFQSIMKNLGFIQFGKNFFDPNKKIYIPEYHIEVWPGFVTTINIFESGLFMCCDVSHRILRCQTVLEVINDIVTNSKKYNLNIVQEIISNLCSSIIITRYNNKTYRIDDIDFNLKPTSTFDKNGVATSYIDYYKNMYNIQICDLKQPMLISKKKKKSINMSQDDFICLVPELCSLTGLTNKMTSDFKFTRTLQKYTTITPGVRQKALIELVNSINAHEIASKKFNKWGLKFHSLNPINLEGPVHKREVITLGNKVKKQVGVNMDWGLDVVKNALFKTVDLSNWAILHLPNDLNTAKSFFKAFSSYCVPLGMKIHVPLLSKVHGQNMNSFISTINNIVLQHKELQLIVIIFPSVREDWYNAVKRICCAKIGIPSQVIISKTLSKPDQFRSIVQKIAVQVNCKLGGAGWAINIPLANTMIIGIDVYHEKNLYSPSVVGFVASVDKTYTSWFSYATIQKNTYEEIMSSFQITINKALAKYKEINNMLPDKIIIYRDGISDGDFIRVEEIEIFNLKNAIKNFSANYCPMITFIIVQKRINTKIFQMMNDQYSNPSPGTVIDNTITRRNYFDFFLVSQLVRQGTVNPTHYVVLKNECKLSTENVQKLSYKLCHMYYNWSGTIKIPAPVQYAHKLAYLIGQNVKEMPNENLSNILYYL